MTNDLSAKILAIIKDCGSFMSSSSLSEETLPDEFCFNGDNIYLVVNEKGPSTNFTITCVEDWGGEDQGSSYGYVFKFSSDTIEFYLRCVGHYSSWEDIEWMESSIVSPQPKQVTLTDWVELPSNDPLADCPELLL